MLDNLIFSLNATVPVFALMLLGWILKRTGMLTPEFTAAANRLTFQITLPALLFTDLYAMDPAALLNGKFAAFCFLGSAAAIGAVWLGARLLVRDKSMVGSFVQASYRGSVALLGVALITNIYGDAGMMPLTIVAAVPLYNVMAVVVLTLEARGGGRLTAAKLRDAGLNILKNPLILAILLSLPFSLLHITLPTMLDKTLRSLGSLAAPLALLAIGAGFELGDARQRRRLTISASLLKLVIQPLVLVPLAVLFGFRGEELMSIAILTASPTTASSYIMAQQMDNDGPMAIGPIVVTTLAAPFTITALVFTLRTLGLM